MDGEPDIECRNDVERLFVSLGLVSMGKRSDGEISCGDSSSKPCLSKKCCKVSQPPLMGKEGRKEEKKPFFKPIKLMYNEPCAYCFTGSFNFNMSKEKY